MIETWGDNFVVYWRFKMSISKRVRFEVFKRDSFRCRYCGTTPGECELEVDHIHPRSLGGSDNLDNLATSCRDCNAGKSGIPLNTAAASTRGRRLIAAIGVAHHQAFLDALDEESRLEASSVFDPYDPEEEEPDEAEMAWELECERHWEGLCAG